MAPLRALVASGGRRTSGAKRSSAGSRGGSRTVGRRPNLGRPALGSVNRLGPPAAAGRWSLVAPLLEPRPTPTEAAHAQALQLLERHGVLTREAVLAEGIEGGFAAVYPVLKALEERGQVRRGYFVAGLGGAQFALPGAVDRLRAVREIDPNERSGDGVGTVVLAATDPAQPFGAALPWPESSGRPARAAGALVVLAAGEPVAYLERGGRSLVVFPSAEHHPDWAATVAGLVGTGPGRRSRLEIARIDGEPAATSPHAEALRAAGFRDGYRGLVLGGR
jgi:ATP-dependent Lhr-like helicase